MSIAMKYVNREIVAIFVVTLLMLLLVAVGGRFIGYLQEAALGKFTGQTVLTIMYLRMPEFVQLVSPFAMYVAIVLTFGRLFAEQEMVVLQGAGASTGTLMRWCSLAVALITLMVGTLSVYVTPASQQVFVDFMAEQRAQTEFETVNPGLFHIYDRGKRVTYSQAMSSDQRMLYQVFMAERMPDGRNATVWAESARQQTDPLTGDRFLVLMNGRRYEGTPDQPDFRIVEFVELQQRLTVNERRRRSEVEAVPTLSLSSSAEEQGEWHWRLGAPIFCLVGSLLGLGISRVKPRQGRFARIVPGMLLMLIYYLALLINRNALVEGQLPAGFGLWITHGVFGVIAVILLKRFAEPVKA